MADGEDFLWTIHAAAGHKSKMLKLSIYLGILARRVQLRGTLLCLHVYYYHSLVDIACASKHMQY